MSTRRIPNLEMSILKDLYRPDFDPNELKINNATQLPAEVQEDIERRVQEVEQRLFSGDAPRPLTKEEAAIIEERVDALRNLIASTRRRISSFRSRIDEQAAPEGQAEISFTVDLSKKGRLRRAVKRAFGSKIQTLTYSMYQSALEAKRVLEEQEAEAYTSTDWQNAEED